MSGKALLVLVVMGLLFCWSCGPNEHLRADFGKQSRDFMAKQRVPMAVAADAPRGLDSEEAALIHSGYRKLIGGDAAVREVSRQESAKVLVLEEGGQKGAGKKR